MCAYPCVQPIICLCIHIHIDTYIYTYTSVCAHMCNKPICIHPLQTSLYKRKVSLYTPTDPLAGYVTASICRNTYSRLTILEASMDFVMNSGNHGLGLSCGLYSGYMDTCEVSLTPPVTVNTHSAKRLVATPKTACIPWQVILEATNLRTPLKLS